MSAIYARIVGDASKDRTVRSHRNMDVHVMSYGRGVRVQAYRNEAGVGFRIYETDGDDTGSSHNDKLIDTLAIQGE